jgi:hypothetical protein
MHKTSKKYPFPDGELDKLGSCAGGSIPMVKSGTCTGDTIPTGLGELGKLLGSCTGEFIPTGLGELEKSGTCTGDSIPTGRLEV